MTKCNAWLLTGFCIKKNLQKVLLGFQENLNINYILANMKLSMANNSILVFYEDILFLRDIWGDTFRYGIYKLM